MMGWWKPFFFSDLTGVQLFFDWLTVDSFEGFLAALLLLLVLACTARMCPMLATALDSESEDWDLKREVKMALLHSLSKLASLLLMLAAMSFNTVLFFAVVAVSGLAHLAARKIKHKFFPRQTRGNNLLQGGDASRS